MAQLKRQILIYGAIFAALLFVSMAAVLLVSTVAQTGSSPQASDTPSLVILRSDEEGPALLVEQEEDVAAVLCV